MNGSTDLKNKAVTPSSGGRPIYATKQHPPWTPDPALGHLLYTMRHVGPKIPPGPETDPDYEDNVAEAEEDYEFLEQLLQSRQLNSLVKSHNVILFCNQEQCPCVSNACQITADVMEDIRPFALMIEECRELYALLSAPHVRVRPKFSSTIVKICHIAWSCYLEICRFRQKSHKKVILVFFSQR